MADDRFRAPDAFEIAINDRRQIVIGDRVLGEHARDLREAG